MGICTCWGQSHQENHLAVPPGGDARCAPHSLLNRKESSLTEKKYNAQYPTSSDIIQPVPELPIRRYGTLFITEPATRNLFTIKFKCLSFCHKQRAWCLDPLSLSAESGISQANPAPDLNECRSGLKSGWHYPREDRINAWIETEEVQLKFLITRLIDSSWDNLCPV